EEVDGQQRAADGGALSGVDLDSAPWRITAPVEGQPIADKVTFERRVPKYGLVVSKTYRLSQLPADAAGAPSEQALDKPAFDLTLEVAIRNDAETKRSVSYRLDGPNGLPIEGWWYATKIGRSGAVGLRDVVGRFFTGEPQQFGAAAIAKGDAKDFEGSGLAYMGVDAQYFCVALVPQVGSPEESWIPRASSVVAGTLPDLAKGQGRFANVTCRLFSKPIDLQPGESVTHAYTVVAGPKRPDLLAKYQAADLPAYSLRDYVYYGWFGAVAQLMVGLLHVFYSIVHNYGVAIIMLTVLVRGCMFPISRGQAKSMAKLQELRPEMDRIKEKYKGDQTKQAQAMQDLYRKHKVNPLAGCLPMLIQLPVFIGLYRGLAVDVELRQAPLLSENIRWCSNLAAPDMLLDWSGFMPAMITSGEGFFGLGPYLNILPLVTIVLFLLQQKLFMPPPTNEQAAMQQKIMTYMMIFMGLLFYKVPSGLCIYFIASSLWGIAERKMVPPPAAGGVAGAPSDGPSERPGRSGGGPRDKLGRNGDAGGKGRAKSKRRR
ncbi:MAG: YidC/Oxa1 family insertase periplasmic-domain containing protein, partial [Pirellulales bacterium]|nr:YidC/Oxa1 family insertase periplasmic-domain containing protein [Pirellulales bacterium]